MDALGAFLATLDVDDGKRDLACHNLPKQALWCEVRKVIAAHVRERDDGLPVILGHKQERGVDREPR